VTGLALLRLTLAGRVLRSASGRRRALRACPQPVARRHGERPVLDRPRQPLPHPAWRMSAAGCAHYQSASMDRRPAARSHCIRPSCQPPGVQGWRLRPKNSEPCCWLFRFSWMSDELPPSLRVRVRRCTIHAGRFRWDIVEGTRAIQSAPNSYPTREEAGAAGRQEMERLQSSKDFPGA
jgi:hypothetical protein